MTENEKSRNNKQRKTLTNECKGFYIYEIPQSTKKSHFGMTTI